MKFKINPSLLDHYFRHLKTGVFVALPFIWDAVEKFKAAGHQLRFDRMTVLGVASIALVPLVQALYGRYVKQYPHLQPEIQFVTNEATKFLEGQLADAQAKPAVTPVVAPPAVPVVDNSTVPGYVNP